MVKLVKALICLAMVKIGKELVLRSAKWMGRAEEAYLSR